MPWEEAAKQVDLRGNAVNYPAIKAVGIVPNHAMRRAYQILDGTVKYNAMTNNECQGSRPLCFLRFGYLRFAMPNSASFATMSGPDDAGLTALSMWRILPSGAM